MQRVTTVAELRDAVRGARGGGARVGFVPTLGALHDGHLANVREMATRSQLRVVSIFVNPLQFGPGEDFAAYPRDLDGDDAALSQLGDDAPDLVYAPEVREVYPGFEPGVGTGIATTVSVARLNETLCGASRPGHFDGVATVVAKLLNQVQPDVACFGRKDFQQLQVIRRMVADLDLPVEIVGVPTVREPDGLAMSSRNTYLDDEERRAARCLSQGLRSAVLAAREARGADGPVTAGLLRDAALGTIQAEPRARVDYIEAVDPDTLAPPDPGAAETGGADGGEVRELLVALAVHVGPARLIDNVVVGDIEDEQRLLDATDGDDG
ncbi:MAG: pantoate--beta-alanine ligase [Actinobacteria bacterium]|nr:pantoate--beta-alanine ligase [Actinomycetota bacterium]